MPRAPIWTATGASTRAMRRSRNRSRSGSARRRPTRGSGSRACATELTEPSTPTSRGSPIMPSPTDRGAAHAREVSPEARELLATARADMAAGCWRELHELLAPAARLRAELPELDVIVAECELRRGAPRNALEVLAEL